MRSLHSVGICTALKNRKAETMKQVQKEIYGQLKNLVVEMKEKTALPNIGLTTCLRFIEENERYGFISHGLAVKMTTYVMRSFKL